MRSAARRLARTAVAAVATAPACPAPGAAAAWAGATPAWAGAGAAIGGARFLQHASSSSTDIRAVMAEKIPVQQVS